MIDDVQRGLGRGIRRPVVSHQSPEIDNRIANEKIRIRNTVADIVNLEMLKTTPPQKKYDDLNRYVGYLYDLILQRINHLNKISHAEYSKILKHTEELDKVPYIDESWRRKMIDKIYYKLGRRMEEKMAWLMKKLKKNNHPVWQKAAMEAISVMALLGIDLVDETALVQEYQAAYYQEREARQKKHKAELKAREQDYTKTYKRIQEHPDDALFVRAKSRGIADQGL